MSNRLKVFLSESKNPHLNIATEEWIFDNLDPSQQVLFLWQNEETVVIGRNQNPWSECNLAKMKEDKVHLARRKTGGGAVFHDLGNICFTFLSPREEYKRENNVQIIFNALKELGIHGEASGRNDLLIPFPDGPRKFSGSAYREKKDRAFHHGTLLLHADLTRLGNYLTPNPKKLQAKGKESVRARVANLDEVRPGIKAADIVEKMVPAFEKFYNGKPDIEMLSLESVNKNAELKGHYDQLSSWDWLYGNTLEFNHKMDDYLSLGFFEFHFKVEEGIIKHLQIFTDCLYPSLIEQMTEDFTNKPYRADSVHAVIKHSLEKHPDLLAALRELEAWLCKHIEI